MFSLIRKILSGFTNTTSTESSGEKENNMFVPKARIPEFDQEQAALFKASEILESIGNDPGLTANQFYDSLIMSDCPVEEHESLTLAAIAIETMMTYDNQFSGDEFEEPTVH